MQLSPSSEAHTQTLCHSILHTAFLTAYYRSLFWATIIYLTNSWPYLILFFHTHPLHACYMPIQAHRSTIYCRNNIWYRAKIIQLSAASFYCVLLGSKSSPQHRVLQCYQFRAISPASISTPIQNRWRHTREPVCDFRFSTTNTITYFYVKRTKYKLQVLFR